MEIKKLNGFSGVRLQLFGLVTALALGTPAFADDGVWMLRKQQSGISIYDQKTADSPINIIRAETEMDAPVQAVVALLQNVSRRPAWNSLCRKAGLLQVAGESRELAYFYYDMPWPVSDRDVVMELSVSAAEGAVTISGSSIKSSYQTGGDVVRINHAWEKWEIHKSGSGSRVTMTAFMDPAGPIPAWLINSMSVSQPYEMMARLREVASRQP